MILIWLDPLTSTLNLVRCHPAKQYPIVEISRELLYNPDMALEALRLEQLQQIRDAAWIITDRNPSLGHSLRTNVEIFASAIGDTWLKNSALDEQISIEQLMADAFSRIFNIGYIGEEKITRMYYGIDALRGLKRMTDRQISEEIGLPRRAITRIRHRCLEAIRKNIRVEMERREAQENYDTWNTPQF